MAYRVLPLSQQRCSSTKGSFDVEIDRSAYNFYTEKATRLIYDVRFFGDCVIVRPATPWFADAIQKMPKAEFDELFEEFWGDPTEIIDAIESAYKDGTRN
jgi:hypothetical protein